jgi:flagellar motor switch protein FliM
MSDEEEIDDDAVAAEWEASLAAEETAAAPAPVKTIEEDDGDIDDEAVAAEWAAMVDSDDGEGLEIQSTAATSPTRVLNQDEIDSLLGFSGDDEDADKTGIRAIVNSSLVSYERLPMLEVVFDRLVRVMTTSLRNFTSDNVEVSLDNMTSIRFGDYLNSIPLPAMLTVFRAEEWDNYGLLTVESNLIYSIVDVLLGGRIELVLPYSTIEPVRELLLQMFMGEKFGRDSIWEGHLATEIWDTDVTIEAVLDESMQPLKDMMTLEVGQTIVLNATPDSPVQLRSGDINLMRGKMGRVSNNVAIQIDKNFKRARAAL